MRVIEDLVQCPMPAGIRDWLREDMTGLHPLIFHEWINPFLDSKFVELVCGIVAGGPNWRVVGHYEFGLQSMP